VAQKPSAGGGMHGGVGKEERESRKGGEGRYGWLLLKRQMICPTKSARSQHLSPQLAFSSFRGLLLNSFLMMPLHVSPIATGQLPLGGHAMGVLPITQMPHVWDRATQASHTKSHSHTVIQWNSHKVNQQHCCRGHGPRQQC